MHTNFNTDFAGDKERLVAVASLAAGVDKDNRLVEVDSLVVGDILAEDNHLDWDNSLVADLDRTLAVDPSAAGRLVAV